MKLRSPGTQVGLAILTGACMGAHAIALHALGLGAAIRPLSGERRPVVVHVREVASPVETGGREDAASPSLVARAAAPRIKRRRPAEAVASAAAPVEVPLPSNAGDGYLAASALDIAPLPKSGPDDQGVEALARSGLPIRLRLFVEDDGVVSRVELLSATSGDEEVAQEIMAMFQATAYSPGRLSGRDVRSFIDVEIVLEPLLPMRRIAESE